MVFLSVVESSNARIASTLPPGLVAVFVGGTNGIGEATLKQFAKHARQPRVYFVGRSQEAGDRIAAKCKVLNAEGEYIFIKADTSLVRTVDDICRDIKNKEKSINLLFLTIGTMIGNVARPSFDSDARAVTSEGLYYPLALTVHCRARFIVNLLPLLQKATTLRRVVSVFAATKEGPIDTTDFHARKGSPMSQRGHASSLVTLSLEALAKKASDVSFVHSYPAPVKSGLTRGTKGAMMFMIKAVIKVIGPLVYVTTVESGERHVFLATSARYPAGTSDDATSGVSLIGEITVARGTDSKVGGGVYSVDSQGESAEPKVEKLLAQFRQEGMVEKVWEHIEDEFKRITGTEAA